MTDDDEPLAIPVRLTFDTSKVLAARDDAYHAVLDEVGPALLAHEDQHQAILAWAFMRAFNLGARAALVEFAFGLVEQGATDVTGDNFDFPLDPLEDVLDRIASETSVDDDAE